MSKSKKQEDYRNFYDEPNYYDEYKVHRTKEEKMRNKRKERRIDHAIRTKNLDELLEVEDDWDFD